MIGELTGPVTSYPNGACSRHNAAMIFKNGATVCLLCDRERARAEKTQGLVNQEADPGHEAMKAILAQHVKESMVPDKVAEAVEVEGAKQRLLEVIPSANLKEHLAAAVSHLQKSPMPKSIAHFKAVQRAIALLEKITGEI